MAHYTAFTGRQEDLADLKVFFEKIRSKNKKFYFWQFNTGKLKFEYEITLPYRKPEHVQFHFYAADLIGYGESDKKKNVFHLYFRNDYTVTIDSQSLVPLAVTTWKEDAEGMKRPDRVKELEKEKNALEEGISQRDKLIEEHEKFKDTVERETDSLRDSLAKAKTSSAELEKEKNTLEEEIRRRDKLIEEHEKFKDTVERETDSLRDALAKVETLSATTRKVREKNAISRP